MYNEDMALGKRSFLALAAVGWADGSLQRIEATGILRAAREWDVSEEDLAEIEAAVKKRSQAIDELELGGMSAWDQVMTYALAAWLAQLDGVVSTDENVVLVSLAEKLGLAETTRKKAFAAVYDIACLPEGGRPEKYDFAKLTARLAERLPR